LPQELPMRGITLRTRVDDLAEAEVEYLTESEDFGGRRVAFRVVPLEERPMTGMEIAERLEGMRRRNMGVVPMEEVEGLIGEIRLREGLGDVPV
jgi:hypothetical protein